MKNINEAFSPEESKEIYDKFISIVNTRRDNLVKKYGKEAERVAYASAVNQVKKKATKEPTIEEPMDQEQKLKEMIQAALSKPLDEKKKSFPDLTGDGKVTKADILKGRGVKLNEGVVDEIENYFKIMIQNQPEDFLALIMDLVKNDGKNWGEWIDSIQYDIVDTSGGDYTGNIRGYREELEEDLDLGHTDNEPHMLKSDLYDIGKYAIELYKIVNQFEGEQEVDFPHWWQSKIVKAKELIDSAKHYLEFELKEPQIDNMTNIMHIDEKMSKKQIKKRGEIYDALKDQGMSDEKAGRIATAKAQKIKEAVLAKLKESKGEYAKIEKQIADLKSKGKNAGDTEMQKLIKRRAELEKSKK